jgi:hypothetical protein
MWRTSFSALGELPACYGREYASMDECMGAKTHEGLKRFGGRQSIKSYVLCACIVVASM